MPLDKVQIGVYNYVIDALYDVYDILGGIVIVNLPKPPIRGWNSRIQLVDASDRLWFAIEKYALLEPNGLSAVRRARLFRRDVEQLDGPYARYRS